jgi:ubiquinone/menaquinone biosynthesis C-methylase UbiE
VVNQEVLVHVLQEEDRKAMIAETKRVLKPGGIYICSICSAVAQHRRALINRVTGYNLLSRLKHRLAGRQGREDFQDVMEFQSYWDIKEVRRCLQSIELTVLESVGHTFFFGGHERQFPCRATGVGCFPWPKILRRRDGCVPTSARSEYA